jgi:hypothetical protein
LRTTKLLTKAYYQLLKEQRTASSPAEAAAAASSNSLEAAAASSNSLEARLAPTSGFEAAANSQGGPRLGWDVLRQANLPQVPSTLYNMTFYVFSDVLIFL